MRDQGAGLRRTLGVAVAACMALSTGCVDAVKNTELRPEGPPEVLQVLAQERGGDELVARLAFGDHADVDPQEDDREVTDAVAGADQRIRVVVDELLVGNTLEQVLCADGSWSAVADGADREAVARCAGTDIADCTAACVGIGIMDANGDRGFDDTRLFDGIVTLDCDGVDIAADLDRSYYQPSGNQLVPAGPLGLEGLGPALVIVPRDPLPTGSRCHIQLAPSIVDHDGHPPCAAAAGGACEPGDTSAIEIGVEPLLALATEPADGATDVAPATGAATIHVTMNVPVSVADAVVAVTAGGAPVSAELSAPEDEPGVVIVTLADGLAAAADYQLTLSGVADAYGGALPEPVTVTWTTREP